MTGPEMLGLLSRAGVRVKLLDDQRVHLEPRAKVTAELAALVRENKPAVVAALLERDRPVPDAAGFRFGELAAWDHIAGEWVSFSEWMFRAAQRTAAAEAAKIRKADAARARQEREREEMERASTPRQGSFAA